MVSAPDIFKLTLKYPSTAQYIPSKVVEHLVSVQINQYFIKFDLKKLSASGISGDLFNYVEHYVTGRSKFTVVNNKVWNSPGFLNRPTIVYNKH